MQSPSLFGSAYRGKGSNGILAGGQAKFVSALASRREASVTRFLHANRFPLCLKTPQLRRELP